MRSALAAALLSLAGAALGAEEIVVGGEATASRQGGTLVVHDARERRDLLIPLDRVVLVLGAREEQSNSTTDIRLATAGGDGQALVVRIPQRAVPWSILRPLLTK